MKYDTSELCDIYRKMSTSLNPVLQLWWTVVVWRTNHHGEMFRDNGLLYDLLEENGRGRVLLVDGGGSVRRALIDADLARLAVQNEWEGIVVYGSVRRWTIWKIRYRYSGHCRHSGWRSG